MDILHYCLESSNASHESSSAHSFTRLQENRRAAAAARLAKFYSVPNFPVAVNASSSNPSSNCSLGDFIPSTIEQYIIMNKARVDKLNRKRKLKEREREIVKELLSYHKNMNESDLQGAMDSRRTAHDEDADVTIRARREQQEQYKQQVELRYQEYAKQKQQIQEFYTKLLEPLQPTNGSLNQSLVSPLTMKQESRKTKENIITISEMVNVIIQRATNDLQEEIKKIQHDQVAALQRAHDLSIAQYYSSQQQQPMVLQSSSSSSSPSASSHSAVPLPSIKIRLPAKFGWQMKSTSSAANTQDEDEQQHQTTTTSLLMTHQSCLMYLLKMKGSINEQNGSEYSYADESNLLAAMSNYWISYLLTNYALQARIQASAYSPSESEAAAKAIVASASSQSQQEFPSTSIMRNSIEWLNAALSCFELIMERNPMLLYKILNITRTSKPKEANNGELEQTVRSLRYNLATRVLSLDCMFAIISNKTLTEGQMVDIIKAVLNTLASRRTSDVAKAVESCITMAQVLNLLFVHGSLKSWLEFKATNRKQARDCDELAKEVADDKKKQKKQ